MNKTINILYFFLLNQFGGKHHKWTTLFHNGIIFYPEYKPHNMPLKYKDKMIQLSSQAEEYAMIYSKYINTEYINNRTFNKNFWNDWKKMLGKDSEIESLEDCDFTEYYNKYMESKI
jgi:DNA topoisomerase-1